MAQLPTRDSVTTIDQDGSRPFLFPTDVHGRFATARRYAAFALLAFYFSLPWIQINGYPAVFIDLAERRFHLFGLNFAAQDTWLLFFLITGTGFSLFFVTATFGRIWCGWACPQTVFLDQVYRRIERWIDGDAPRRRALAQRSVDADKVVRRVVKHALYLAASIAITHLFLSYFVSLPEVWSMMRTAPGDHWSAFAFMAVSTGILYFNFAWFREQLCIVICPYGRIQSALIDEHSLVIGYDVARGEPRGKPNTDGVGDCVACNRCVQVCPTGIDIRQGLQMECIGCTACIDACDDVMTRLQRPKGLIRYDSQASIAGGRTRWVRPRTLLYFGLLAVGASVAAWAVSTLRPASLSITRIVGAPYLVDGESVRNQFFVRVVNKHNAPVRFIVHAETGQSGVKQVGLLQSFEVPALGEMVQPLVLVQPRNQFSAAVDVDVSLSDEAHSFSLVRRVEFLGPTVRATR